MIWYVEENKRKYPTVIPFHGILLSGMLRKTLESMKEMFENNDVATKRRDDGATRQRIDVATWQRSNAATD